MSNAVLVLDSVPQTLAVVRSLARAGYRVVLGRAQGQRKSHIEWSRHCHEVWLHPPLAEPVPFRIALSALLERRPDVRTIFPVSETSIDALVHGDACVAERGVTVAMVQEDLFVSCRDKVLGHGLATRAGLRVPESLVVQDLDSLRRSVERLGFPMIIKPLGATRRVHGRKAYLVEGRAEFDVAFSAWDSGVSELLVQRYVSGPLASCDYVAAEGRLIGYCEARVLRTDMPDGTGFAVDFESIPPTRDLFEAATRFVDTHGYTGPGLMQFIRSCDTGELFFLENNPRLAAGIAHTIDSGQDLPRLAVEAAAGSGSAATVGTDHFAAGAYRYGYRAHWLMRDIQGYRARRKELGRAQRRRWLLELARSCMRANSHITWRWHDPMPTVVLYIRFLRRHLMQLAATRRR